MKIAITSHGKNRHGVVDFRFTQAEYFMLYNPQNTKWKVIYNTKNLQSIYDAGTQAGHTLKKTGAKVLITGHIGPKVFKLLQSEQILIYSINTMNSTNILTVEDALSAFLSGTLLPIIVPNALDLKQKHPSQKK